MTAYCRQVNSDSGSERDSEEEPLYQLLNMSISQVTDRHMHEAVDSLLDMLRGVREEMVERCLAIEERSRAMEEQLDKHLDQDPYRKLYEDLDWEQERNEPLKQEITKLKLELKKKDEEIAAMKEQHEQLLKVLGVNK